MAKALFFSLPLTGHVNPSLALVHELAGRGDDVIYFATDAFAARVQKSNARYRPYRNRFLTNMEHLPEHMDELSWLLMRTTEEVLGDELEAFRAERPDYLITDSAAPWGQWVAEILGVPAVTSVSTFAFNRRVLRFAVTRGVRPKSARRFLSKLRHIAKALSLRQHLRRRYNVDGPGVTGLVLTSSDMNIVYTSRYFQLSFSSLFPVLFGKSPELNPARFVWVQCQSELSQPFPKLVQKTICVGPILEPEDVVIRVSDDSDITSIPTAFS